MNVSFAQAKSWDFDLVIGADGLHSNVRRLTFGPESDVEHYLGCRVAACVVETYRPRDDLVYVTYSEPGRSIGQFTLRGDRTLFLFVFRSRPTPPTPATLQARKGDSAPRIRCCRPGNAPHPRQRWTASMICTSMSSAKSGWTAGRGPDALIGDAAACVSLLAARGTGLAMTDAYVLAGELACAPGDYRRAFDATSATAPFRRSQTGAAQENIFGSSRHRRAGHLVSQPGHGTMNFVRSPRLSPEACATTSNCRPTRP